MQKPIHVNFVVEQNRSTLVRFSIQLLLFSGVRRWELVISLTITMLALLSLHTFLLVFGFLSYYEMTLGIPMTTGITLMHLHILMAGVIGEFNVGVRNFLQ